MGENLLYLLLSVSLSAGRNVISKKTAAAAGNRRSFFFSQAVLFLSAAVLLGLCGGLPEGGVSGLTVAYGLVYGVLLVLSQWMLTLALRCAQTGVCSAIYSLGFILPTLSGAVFWGEGFTAADFAGLTLAVGAILLPLGENSSGGQQAKRFLPFILTAMLASGGLGIVQKLQQSSPAAQQRGAFLVIAFVLAFGCSFGAFLLCGRTDPLPPKAAFCPALTGACFGGANLCNTVLAGRLESAVFFPVQNISVILLSALLGIVVFREKLTARTGLVLLLGAAAVVLLSL